MVESDLYNSTTGQRKRVLDVSEDLSQRFLDRHPIGVDDQLARRRRFIRCRDSCKIWNVAGSRLGIQAFGVALTARNRGGIFAQSHSATALDSQGAALTGEDQGWVSGGPPPG